MRSKLSILSILACCSVLLLGCKEAERQTFCIHGAIPGLQAGVELALLNSENRSSDETLAVAIVQKDGEFLLEGTASHPTLCTLTTNNLAKLGDEAEKDNYASVKWTYTPVFVDNSDMEIQVPAYDLVPDAPETKDFHIVGSPSHDDYCAYVALCGGVEDYEPRFDVAIQFVREHPQSVVSVYVANKLLTNGYNLTSEQLQQLEKAITGCPSDTARFARFQERLAIAHQTVTGNSVVNLDLVTPEGTSCQLADVVKEHAGKLLLVDFWASWCGICRAATPDLKVLYETYSRDQFEIISVSCDEKDDAWRSAMEKDQMPWAQYCLTAQGYQDFFSKYQVVGVPYYLLLDSTGKVITNPSGVEGVKKLVKEKLQ